MKIKDFINEYRVIIIQFAGSVATGIFSFDSKQTILRIVMTTIRFDSIQFDAFDVQYIHEYSKEWKSYIKQSYFLA